MQPFKVLITTSGIGSRLGDFTKYTNKSLLRIGSKPSISHIIENYPDETKFVITLGYFGNQVKDFLTLAYPERNFEFVTVDNFQGEGSSLLLSMSNAKPFLQEPFIFHASDTIILDEVPAPSYNWNAGFKGTGSSAYASFDVLGKQVKVIYEKGNLNPDFLHIGLVGINDYKLFWEIADKILIEKNYRSSLGDVDVLQQMVKTSPFKVFQTSEWLDIGNVDRMNEAKAKIDDKSIHVLDKLGESIFKVNGSIIKFFYDTKICKNRIDRTENLKGIIPAIKGCSENFYKYDYVQGDLFSEVVNKKSFANFLTWLESNLWSQKVDFDQQKFYTLCENFYFTKTTQRLQQFYETRSIEDKVETINGEETDCVFNMLNKIDKAQLCNSNPTKFHGDLILDNVIQNSPETFTLIDWRQDFAGELIAGDKYYDLSKLAHNLVVNHAMVDENLFTINKEDNSILINIHRLQTLVEAENEFYKWLEVNNYDVQKVKILRSIIWLNMAPLHHHPFDIFLYYLGKYSLNNALKNN